MITKTKTNNNVYIAAMIAVILWGFSFIWTNDIINADIPIFSFLFVRLSLAGILLFLFSKITNKLQKINKKDFLWLTLMAFFEPFIYFIGESYGMKATGSAVLAAVIIATIPIACMVTEKIFYKIPFSLNKTIGILLTLVGIILVVLKDGPLTVDHGYGIALLFLAVAGATGYTAIVKKLSGGINTYTIATYQFIIGAILFIPFFCIWGIDGINQKFFTFDVLFPLLSLAILCSCVAFIFWINAIRGLGMTKANIFSALIPGISALGSALFGQEPLTILSCVGITIVVAGVIVAQR